MSSSSPLPKARFSTRTKARKGALDVLFESEVRRIDPLEALHQRVLEADPPVREYTAELVEGVNDNLPQIDERISSALGEGWSLDRMPRVDRALARIAVYEMDRGRVPAQVAIAEALVLAGELSTDESPAFLNGVLSAVAKVPVMNEEQVAKVHGDHGDDRHQDDRHRGGGDEPREPLED